MMGETLFEPGSQNLVRDKESTMVVLINRWDIQGCKKTFSGTIVHSIIPIIKVGTYSRFFDKDDFVPVTGKFQFDV